MYKNFMKYAVVLGMLCAFPAYAQSSYPTPNVNIKSNVVVPLQCSSSNADCKPVTATNPVPVTGSITSTVTGTVTSTGNVASASTDSGNPIKIGCVYNSTTPTVTTTQRVDCQSDSRGPIRVVITGADGTQTPQITTPGDGLSASISGMAARSFSLGYNGSTWDRIRGDTNAISVLPGLSTTQWSYTSGASPILSNTTTAVTIKTAAGASVRNFIDACQLTTTAFGAAVPLAIRDGAGGTVLFALTVPTAGFLQPVNVQFRMPLRGTANTLLEVVTTTANTSGTVTLNCQGHTGS